MRVDLIELNNKSIDQVNPSEYAFVKKFNPEVGHTVMYFVENTETCTQLQNNHLIQLKLTSNMVKYMILKIIKLNMKLFKESQ